MEQSKKSEEVLSQVAGKAVETMTVWADANQRVLRSLVDLSAATAKEGVRLYAELQQGALEAFRDSQAAALRWQTAWQEAPKDPAAWYQKAVVASVDDAQKAFRLFENNAQAITKSAERFQATAEQASKGMQETFTGVVAKLKDVYASN